MRNVDPVTGLIYVQFYLRFKFSNLERLYEQIPMRTILLFFFLYWSAVACAQQAGPFKKDNILKTSGKIIRNSVLSVPGDFAFMGKEISDDWGKTGLYSLGIVNLILTDKITTRFLQDHIEPNVNYSLPDISVFKKGKHIDWLTGNDAYMSYPVIGLYAGSLLMNNEKGQYVAVNAFKSLSYSILITQLGLKTIFGRNRPNRPLGAATSETGPWTNNHLDFFNTRSVFLSSDAGASSFPSLHTTAYFAMAKVFQMEYDNYWIPYGLMSLFFLADLKEHNHWVGDMVTGGLVGTLIGRSVVKNSWKIRYGTPAGKKKDYTLHFIPQFLPQTDYTPAAVLLTVRLNPNR